MLIAPQMHPYFTEHKSKHTNIVAIEITIVTERSCQVVYLIGNFSFTKITQEIAIVLSCLRDCHAFRWDMM